METLKSRLNQILADENLLELVDEIRKTAIEVDTLIGESEKDKALQESDEYQDMIDEFQDEILSMLLELFEVKVPEPAQEKSE